jgi:hypothetical protein
LITKQRYYGGETFADFMARVVTNRPLWAGVTNRVSIPLEISGRLQALGGHWHLLVLNEDWCGDAVNIVPIVGKLAESVSNMDLRILARDENLDIMDAHLTDGKSRSIPIVILLDEDFRECGWWGPRPHALQRWVKEEGLTLPNAERYLAIRTFYARDRGVTTMTEIVGMLEQCCVRASRG